MLASARGIIYNLGFKKRMKLKSRFWQVFLIIFPLGICCVLSFIIPTVLQNFTHWIGSAVCHQLPHHSLSLNGRQFALCARCTGTYLSACIGLVYFFSKGKKAVVPSKSIFILFLFFFLFWIVDGVNSFIYEVLHHQFLYTPSNILRFLSGIGMGMVYSLIIMTIVNYVFWKNKEQEALLKNWKDAGLLILCESVLVFFLFSKSNYLFNLAGLISTLTVVVLIGLLYAILVVILAHKEGSYQNRKDAFIPLLIGLGIAILQIILMVHLRMKLTNFSIFPL
jgi:uncharacterized membrane protein